MSLAAPAGAVDRDEVGEATDSVIDDIIAGAWLDPKAPFWAPRRGERFEIGLRLGGEGSFAALVGMILGAAFAKLRRPTGSAVGSAGAGGNGPGADDDDDAVLP